MDGGAPASAKDEVSWSVVLVVVVPKFFVNLNY